MQYLTNNKFYFSLALICLCLGIVTYINLNRQMRKVFLSQHVFVEGCEKQIWNLKKWKFHSQETYICHSKEYYKKTIFLSLPTAQLWDIRNTQLRPSVPMSALNNYDYNNCLHRLADSFCGKRWILGFHIFL